MIILFSLEVPNKQEDNQSNYDGSDNILVLIPYTNENQEEGGRN